MSLSGKKSPNMKRSKTTSKDDEDDNDDDWNFKSLKRTKKTVKVGKSGKNVAKSAVSKNKSKRAVSKTKTKTERMRSQLESDTEDSDCLIVNSQSIDDFRENKKRAFLSSSGLNENVINKSTSSKQTELLVDNDELSHKIQKLTSPLSENSKERKTKRKLSSQEKNKKSLSASKSKNGKSKKKLKNGGKSPARSAEKSKPTIVKRCPFCQVPFSALLRLSPDSHSAECMDSSFLTDADGTM